MSTAEVLIDIPQPPLPPPPATAAAAAELATNMNNLNTVNPAVTISTDGPRLTFPPFPEAPEGVHIEPFSTFQERGIAMDPGPDDAEVDTFGIPTVPLKPRHATDACKTNTKRKRRAEDDASRKKRGLGSKKVPWWQQWEDTESIRFSVGFDRSVNSPTVVLPVGDNVYADLRLFCFFFLSRFSFLLVTLRVLKGCTLRPAISGLVALGQWIISPRLDLNSSTTRSVFIISCWGKE